MTTKTRLYISDFDFTLLKSNLTLPSDLPDFLEQMHTSDIPFGIATARSVHSLNPLLNGIKFSLPLIEYNGGYITDHKTLVPYHIQGLDQGHTDDVMRLSSELDLHPLISAYENSQLFYPPLQPTRALASYLQERTELLDKRLRPAIDPDDINADHIMSLTYMGKEEKISRLHKTLQNASIDVSMHYYQNKYTPDDYWLSIHHEQATKEAAIVRLLDILKLKRDEVDLTVFGDDVNDRGMFSVADHAIAVSNAKPELKELATEVIGSNDEGAVIEYIRDREGL